MSAPAGQNWRPYEIVITSITVWDAMRNRSLIDGIINRGTTVLYSRSWAKKTAREVGWGQSMWHLRISRQWRRAVTVQFYPEDRGSTFIWKVDGQLATRLHGVTSQKPIILKYPLQKQTSWKIYGRDGLNRGLYGTSLSDCTWPQQARPVFQEYGGAGIAQSV
jgi:hypothetical protein